MIRMALLSVVAIVYMTAVLGVVPMLAFVIAKVLGVI